MLVVHPAKQLHTTKLLLIVSWCSTSFHFLFAFFNKPVVRVLHCVKQKHLLIVFDSRKKKQFRDIKLISPV